MEIVINLLCNIPVSYRYVTGNNKLPVNFEHYVQREIQETQAKVRWHARLLYADVSVSYTVALLVPLA